MRLLEADFLSVDLRSITSTNTNGNSNPTNINNQETSQKEKVLPAKFNWGWWGSELTRRIEENKKSAADVRKPEVDIEIEFFKDFFETNWTEEGVAKQLISLGPPLRKAIKTLGFKLENNAGNPFLAFLRQGYVQRYLLKTKLINVNTFKVIYNAIAQKRVAGSEFFKANNYNLIYCRDFYKKPVAEMEKYLQIQSNILTTSASKYTQAKQLKNRATFLVIPQITEKEITKRVAAIVKADVKIIPEMSEANSKLNPLALADKISGTGTLDATAGKSHMTTKNQSAIANKLKSASQVYAALQFLSMNTGSKKAAQALTNDAFKSLSLDKISQATALLTTQKIMPSGEISKAEADNLAGILLGRLRELR